LAQDHLLRHETGPGPARAIEKERTQSVYTPGTSAVFLATLKPSLRIYIKVPYSVPFALSIMGLGFRKGKESAEILRAVQKLIKSA